MITLEALKSPTFLLLLVLVGFGIAFWVTYSLKEFLVSYELHKRQKRMKHLKELELYQEELKKRP